VLCCVELSVLLSVVLCSVECCVVLCCVVLSVVLCCVECCVVFRGGHCWFLTAVLSRGKWEMRRDEGRAQRDVVVVWWCVVVVWWCGRSDNKRFVHTARNQKNVA